MGSLLFIFFMSLGFASQPDPIFSENKYDNGYTEERYDFVLDTLEDVYGKIIEAKGGEFFIARDWTDGAVNMWAERLGNEYWLEVPGGMARYGLIIEEAFILSLCHELGHLLGGEPHNHEISFEGQADYYSTFTCMELVLPHMNQEKALVYDLEVKNVCNEGELCLRTLQGAKSLSSYYAEIEGSGFPQLTTPSSEVAAQTLKAHPKAQCRLDTFFAGFEKRPRPVCWYKAN